MTDTAVTDSYITTIEAAETYFASDPRATAWLALTDALKTWYLQRATKIIDRIPYQGYKLTSSQAREFPRKYSPSYPLSESPWGSTSTEDAYGYIYMSSSVPDEVEDACCEEALALYLHQVDPMAQEVRKMQARGAVSASIGGEGSESWQPGARHIRHGLLSEEAYRLLEKHIENSVAMR